MKRLSKLKMPIIKAGQLFNCGKVFFAYIEKLLRFWSDYTDILLEELYLEGESR